jgi:hypothetical protein
MRTPSPRAWAALGLLMLAQCIGPVGPADDSVAATSDDCLRGENASPAKPSHSAEFSGTWNTVDGLSNDLVLVNHEIDGKEYALIEGDIVLDLKVRVETPSPGEKPLFEAGSVKPWSKGIVPYEFSEGFSNRTLVESAIQEFSGTPVSFVPRTSGHKGPFVCFYDTSDAAIGGLAMLGCNPKITQHKVWINTDPRRVNRGIVIHELMHSLGFGHEQCRSDAKCYITINKDNIIGKYRNQFSHVPLSKDVGTYDYHSITHYPRHAFSKKRGLDTITPVKMPPNGVRPVGADQIGVATRLSAGDRAALKAVYGR